MLVLKAKLEAVEAGITTIEQEFLADMVLPGDVTVGEALLPRLDDALNTGRMPDLLCQGEGPYHCRPRGEHGLRPSRSRGSP